MKRLYVLFTMDCETINEHASEGGPVDWDLSHRSITGFCQILWKYNYNPTLFVVPETAAVQAELLRSCAEKGAELGLHYHPQDHGYDDYLGAYNESEQYRMLDDAVNQWSEHIGYNPESFRGGNASGNDHTFPVLAKLGFKQGSLSIPDRNFTRVKANWRGTNLYPHHAHKANRLLDGDMKFLEVPVTVDPESIMWGGLTPLELRIEMVDSRSHGFTIRKSVERQLVKNQEFAVLVVITHNIFDYSDAGEFRAKVLHGIIEEISMCAQDRQLDIEGITLKEFHKKFDALHLKGSGCF